MTSDAFALPRSDLNGFLFAPVGDEASGMTLSVLSAFARQEMDPWQEAARLASLPAAAAVDRLARGIATMPASLWSLQDAIGIAERLVPLLPKRAGSVAAPEAAAPGGLRWPLAGVLVAAVLLGVWALLGL